MWADPTPPRPPMATWPGNGPIGGTKLPPSSTAVLGLVPRPPLVAAVAAAGLADLFDIGDDRSSTFMTAAWATGGLTLFPDAEDIRSSLRLAIASCNDRLPVIESVPARCASPLPQSPMESCDCRCDGTDLSGFPAAAATAAAIWRCSMVARSDNMAAASAWTKTMQNNEERNSRHYGIRQKRCRICLRAMSTTYNGFGFQCVKFFELTSLTVLQSRGHIVIFEFTLDTWQLIEYVNLHKSDV